MDLLLNDTELAHYNLHLHAKASVKTLADFVLHNHTTKELVELRQEQLKQHPHNTVLRNATEEFLFSLPKNPSKKEVLFSKEKIISKINLKTHEAVKNSSKKLKPGSNVFVHSLTSLLFEVIKHTKQHKNTTKIALTHSPFNYGQHLKKKKELEIQLFNDLELDTAISFADVCLLGGTTIMKNGDAIVKTGSKLCSKAAQDHRIPVYVVATSLHHHPKQQLFKTNKEQIKRYERLSKEHITGYITEQGIIKPEHAVEELQKHDKLSKTH
jgi:translation initiation factor 2B subunit (eIF-2B alpha/beta/delta family)